MRTEILAEDLVLELDEGLKNTPCISLLVDDSTDQTTTVQIMAFVRYFDESEKNLCKIC